MKLEAIGHVRSPYGGQEGTPIQPDYGEAEALVVIDPPWRAALRDLDGFERIWLVTWLDRGRGFRPLVTPYLDEVERGLFATRSPCRPNPIGISCVRLLSVDPAGGVLRIAAVDLLDGTPVLDVKPYVPRFDAHPDARAGWFEGVDSARGRADGRFAAEDEE